jgi:hypothetical protein
MYFLAAFLRHAEPALPTLGSLPDDLGAFIVMTRWAVGRSVVAVLDLPKRINFEAPLINAAIQIFEATGEQVEVAGGFEAGFMRRLDASLGFTEAATTRLVEQCRALVAELKSKKQTANPTNRSSVGSAA